MQPGGRIAHFEVLRLLGAGGMGEVYLARDTRLGREVAIKVLPAEFASDSDRLRRFEQEAHAVAALNHPNILALYDVGTHEGAPYIVTELLEGESLGDRLHAGALPVRKAVDFGIQIAQGLAAAHEKGIVHRDLKPGNVFVTQDGHVKILDFGLAKLAATKSAREAAQTSTAVEATEAGKTVGTVGYMSPEQVRGAAVDQRSDIFSLGCVLYEMLAGRRAFAGGSRADTMSAILHDEPPGLESTASGFPAPLRQIVRRCLEKRPADRFSSAHDLAFALEAAGTDTRRNHPAPSVRGQWPRLPWWSVSLAVVLVLVAAGGIWAALHRGPAPLPQFHPRRIAGQIAGVTDATISPDGNEIAYTTEGGGTSDIWVTDVRGGKPIRLTDGTGRAFGPAWFPDGSSIAFSMARSAETSIWKVPRFGGSAMLLVPNAQDASLSPDGQRIAFARQKGGALRIWVAPLASPEQVRKLTGEGTGLWNHRHPVWSPDGRMLCYSDARHLWLVPSSGGDPRPCTSEDTASSQPAWSPGGAAIYFVSERDGVRSLWRESVAGGLAVRVTQGAGSESSPSVAGDGRRLALLSGQEASWFALVDMQTGNVSRLEQGRTMGTVAIAADRGYVLFDSDRSGGCDLWSMPLRRNAPTGEPIQLTEPPGHSMAPKLSPDGHWIAYQRKVEGRWDVWVAPAEGGNPSNFTDQAGVNVEPAWRPDGRELAFVSNRGGWHQIWAVPFADGRRAGEARRLSREEGDAASPCWAPDGKAIAYVFATDAGGDVRVVPADGTGKTNALTSGARASQVRWSQVRAGWIVSGFWGEQRPSIRVVPRAGGAATELPIPVGIALDSRYPYFELSRDGLLLAVLQRALQEEIWVLEADEGSF